MPSLTYKGIHITYQDQLEYETLIEEVFQKRTYYVDLETNTPLIIDAGAHIGMTTLYLHSVYPNARFICIEPNPVNQELLKKNLEDNNITNAVIEPYALAKNEEVRKFYIHPTLTFFSSFHKKGWTGDQEMREVRVQTRTISSYLNEPVDLLKMDIEGAESEVLIEAGEKLKNVKHLMLEFHKTSMHTEEKLLRVLRNYFPHIDIQTDKRKEKMRNNKLLFIEAFK